MAEGKGPPRVDDESRRYLRRHGYAAWRKWLAEGRPGPAPPELGVDKDRPEEDVVPCHACGAQVRGSVCAECGTPVTPTVGRLLLGLGSSRLLLPWVAVSVLLPVAILRYALSPEGQGDLPLLFALILGPFTIAGVTWYLYRRWYRSRYPDDD